MIEPNIHHHLVAAGPMGFVYLDGLSDDYRDLAEIELVAAHNRLLDAAQVDAAIWEVDSLCRLSGVPERVAPDPRLVRSIRELEARPQDFPRVADLACIAGLSPSRFQALLTQAVGMSLPTRACDRLGQCILFGTDQTVDCSVDLVGMPTAVSGPANERWLAIFLRFDRQLSDPRTDGTFATCGDGVVDTDEVCDDGDNPGARVGDCIPGCSGRVAQELRMRLSLPRVSSDFAAGATSFAEAADALCPEGFKAVITDGSTRIASVTPLAGDGQVDWVLEPFTAYYDEIDNAARWPACCSEGFAGERCCADGVYTGQLVWTTDDVTLLGVRGGEPTALPGPSSIPYYLFDTSGQPIWTGFNPDWTAGPNCSGWTSTSGEESGAIGNSGGRSSRVWSITTNTCGAFTRQILCAEQP